MVKKEETSPAWPWASPLPKTLTLDLAVAGQGSRARPPPKPPALHHAGSVLTSRLPSAFPDYPLHPATPPRVPVTRALPSVLSGECTAGRLGLWIRPLPPSLVLRLHTPQPPAEGSQLRGRPPDSLKPLGSWRPPCRLSHPASGFLCPAPCLGAPPTSPSPWSSCSACSAEPWGRRQPLCSCPGASVSSSAMRRSHSGGACAPISPEGT